MGEGAADPCLAVARALLDFADGRPDQAVLVFCGSLASNESRAVRDRFLEEAADAVEHAWDEQGDGVGGPDVPAIGILAGLFRLLAWELTPDLVTPGSQAICATMSAWIDSYAVPGRRPCWRGRSSNASIEWIETAAVHPDRSAEGERERIALAAAYVIFQKGFEDATEEDIIAVADLPASAFSAHFTDVHGAAMAALELAYERTMAAAARAYVEAAHPWAEQLCRSAVGLRPFLSSDPTLGYLAFAQPHAIGLDAVRMAHDRLMAFTILLEQGYAQSPGALRLPRETSQALIAAVYELTYLQCAHLRERAMPELLPLRTYVTLAPFVGPDEAGELVERLLRPPVS